MPLWSREPRHPLNGTALQISPPSPYETAAVSDEYEVDSHCPELHFAILAPRTAPLKQDSAANLPAGPLQSTALSESVKGIISAAIVRSPISPLWPQELRPLPPDSTKNPPPSPHETATLSLDDTKEQPPPDTTRGPPQRLTPKSVCGLEGTASGLRGYWPSVPTCISSAPG